MHRLRFFGCKIDKITTGGLFVCFYVTSDCPVYWRDMSLPAGPACETRGVAAHSAAHVWQRSEAADLEAVPGEVRSEAHWRVLRGNGGQLCHR